MKKIFFILFGLLTFLSYSQKMIVNGVKISLTDSINTIIKSDVIIQNDGTVVINPHTQLNATGTVLNNSTNNGIVIKASSTQPNGTFIFGNDQNTPLNGTVEMYSKASWDLTRAVNNKYKWQYFGIPVKTFIINSDFDNSYIRKYNETGNGSGSTNDKRWILLGNGSTLTSEFGYEIVQESARIYNFTGQLINSDINKTLTYTATSDYPGQHILSNPYTSAINIKNILFGSDMDSTVYIYNTGSYDDWYNNQSGNGENPGQYYSVPQELAGQSGLQLTIPSMQGFLVKTKNENTLNAKINIPYITSTSKNKEMMRLPPPQEPIPSIVLTVMGKTYNDIMWLFKVDGKTNHFDNGWDGKKITGSIYSPQIYSIGDDGEYQVNSVNDLNKIKIGFQNGQDTVYNLKLRLNDIIGLYPKLYLIDLQNNKTIEIDSDSLNYTFEANKSQEINQRFLIVTSIETENTLIKNDSVLVYNIGNKILINNNSNINITTKIFTVSGQMIGLYNCYGNKVTTIDINLDKGIYIVDTGTKATKILIK